LFSPGGSCIVLLLQLWSASPPARFSFEYCPQFHETSSVIHLGPTLGGWFVTPLPLSAFVPCPIFAESLAPCPTPILRGRFNIPPHPHYGVDYNSLFMFFSFVQGGIQSAQGLCWIMFSVWWVVGKGVMFGMCCSPVGNTCLHRQL
jgi:hypothetical protein